jgi:hypothetical protein
MASSTFALEGLRAKRSAAEVRNGQSPNHSIPLVNSAARALRWKGA